MACSKCGPLLQTDSASLRVKYDYEMLSGATKDGEVEFNGVRKVEWIPAHYCTEEDIGPFDAIEVLKDSRVIDRPVQIYLMYFDSQGALRVICENFVVK